MLHNDVIEQGRFRTLDTAELEVISGGHGGTVLHKDAQSAIVVEATRIGMVDSDFYGYQVGGSVHIFQDTAGPLAEFFGAEDDYMGKFEPGTPDDHDLVLDKEDKEFERNNGFNLDIGPGGGGSNSGSSSSSSSDTKQYWKLVPG